MKRIKVHYGMSLMKAEKAAERHGAIVSPVHQSGVTKYVFPSGRQIKVNARRKDAPKALVKALLELDA